MSDEWCTNYNSWSDDLYEWNKILTIHQTPRGDRERHGTDSSIMLAQLICAKFGSSVSHEYIQWHGKHTVGARQGQCNDTPASATMVNGAGNGSTVPETHQISVASETENLLLTLLRNLKVRWPTRQYIYSAEHHASVAANKYWSARAGVCPDGLMSDVFKMPQTIGYF